jgi:sugar/nucleoside kinase (ribokinase family)
VAAAPAPVLVDVHDYDGHAEYHRAFLEVADLVVASDVALPDPLAFLRARIAAGATTAICTRGASGAIGMAADGTVVEVGAVPVDEVVDTNGAGDAFSVATAVALGRGRDLHTAMTAGAVLGAAAVRSPELAPGTCPAGVVRASD